MKQLLLKIFLLSVLVLVTASAVKYVFYKPAEVLPWAFVSDQIYLKSKIYEKKQKSVNTIFIGSSVVRRGFNPAVFDSLTHKFRSPYSFNFGVNWMGTPESLYMVDHLLLSNSSNLEYAFIELSKLKYVDYSNLHTTRATYWYNSEYMVFTVQAFLGSKTTVWYVKAAALLTHAISFLENRIGLDYWQTINDFQTRKTKLGDTLEFVPDVYLGFDALAGNPELDTEVNAEENVQIGIRKLLNDSSGLHKRKLLSAAAFADAENNIGLNKVNKIYLERLIKLKNDLLNKGIYPVFVLAPRADKRQYEEVLPLFYSLPAQHRINVADSRKYPELYSVKLSADETHLNKNGAARFSEILAYEFIKLMELRNSSRNSN